MAPRIAIVLLGGAVLACGPLPPASAEGAAHAPESVPPALWNDVETGGNPIVLVELRSDDESNAQPLTAAPSGVLTDEDLEIRATVLAARKGVIRAKVPSVVEVQNFRHVPVMAVNVRSVDDLRALAALPEVQSVHMNESFESSLTQSLALIHQPQIANGGSAGAGTSVAILDTGLDYTRAAFGSCSSPGSGGSCKVPFVQDFAASDGVLDDSGHGTNVAGIALGVAPGARVLGLDVFNGSLAYSNDILSAIDWCIQNRSTYNIVALNMSLGSGSFSAPCSSNVFSSSITAAKNAGILSAVASGNNGYIASIASPACAPDAVSVGAVYDANLGPRGWSGCSDSSTAPDKVTCFSNSASFLTVLAPGSVIDAAGITMSGTSQASPHVAGALAVLAAAFPNESPALRLQRLISSGVSVLDTRNQITKPRIDLATAASGCVYMVTPVTTAMAQAGGSYTATVTTGSECAWSAQTSSSWLQASPSSGTGPASITVTVAANGAAARNGTLTVATNTISISQAGDVTAPVGTVTINGGAAATNSTVSTLTLSASDNAGSLTMCVTNTTSCTSWVPYATSTSWALTTGAGTKTVRVTFKDAAGNLSAVASDTIVLDTTAPRDGAVTATSGDGRITLSWSGFSDAATGISSYKVLAAPTLAPASCTSGTAIYTGNATSFVHTLSNGLTYAYRVCAIDNAGNISKGMTASGRTAPEFAAPVGTVIINDGATWAKTAQVKLTLNATDASGVQSMCVSNTATCTTWVNYASTLSWSLASGAGLKTVTVFFKDVWGTVSSAVTDTISVDTTLPANGSVTITRSDAQLSVSWSSFTDSGSGIASYTVVMGTTSAPANCASGTAVASDVTASSWVQSALTNGTAYNFRVCAKDRAGNVSAGTVATGTPVPEQVAPTGSIAIQGGLTITKSPTVPLTLLADDASGVTQMCLSNTTTCTTWVAYATAVNWSLGTSSGSKTISVLFKDRWGNVSPKYSVPIVLDMIAPAGGTLTATAGTKQVSFSWSGIKETQTGISTYTLVYAVGKTAPACTSSAVAYRGTATSYVHSGLTSGVVMAWKLCTTDGAGNVSVGLSKSLAAQ